MRGAVGRPSEAALDACKGGGGEAAGALRRQLMRLGLNTAGVDALVWQ